MSNSLGTRRGPRAPQQQDGIGRREPGHVPGQRREPGRLQQDAVAAEPGGQQRLPCRRNPVQRGHRHHDRPPRPPCAGRHDRRQLTPADRWKVAAYVRALQLSHAAAEGDVPAAELEKLKSGVPAPAAAGAHGSQK